MILQPPQHAADADPLFIHPDDDAWDNDKIDRERKDLASEHAKLVKAHKAGKGTAPGDVPPHPWDRYQAGATRYDLDAKDTIGGTTVTMRAYLLSDATPTVFHLRRVSGRQWSASAARMGQSVFLGAQAKSEEMWNMARLGVVAVTNGEMLTPEARWPLKGGEGGQPLTEEDMQKLFELGQTFVLELGNAVFVASGPLSEAEGKP